MNFLILCWEFFKTGLFAVGGGLATLPFLTQIQGRYNWFSREMLANMIAVSESTPGPIGVNMATYVGYTSHGVLGAVLATFSLVLPSVIVVVLIARFLDSYQENKLVQRAFSCLRPAVTGLIAAAGFSVLKIALFKFADFSGGILANVSWTAVILYACLVAAQFVPKLKKLHPILYIAVGAAAGILLSM